MNSDGKRTLLTGTDSDRTNLQLNLWIDKAYHLPRADKPGYLYALNRVIDKEHVEAVFPQPDPEVNRLSREREKLHSRTFLPDEKTVTTCLDKFQALKIWQKSGVREEPVVLSEKDPSIARKIRELKYPRWIRAREGAGGLLSSIAHDASIANHWVRFHWDQGIKTDFIAEEYLPGRDYCFMSIWNRGTLVTSMIRERLNWVGHRLVGAGGTSRLNHVVHSSKVNDEAVASIQSITRSPHGVICIDLKEDSNKTPHPTEINCRFTTNVHYLTLASIKLGHPEWNFPWLAARLALGEEIPVCSKLNALPEDLWFTKNTDMGFTMVSGDHWRAAEP